MHNAHFHENIWHLVRKLSTLVTVGSETPKFSITTYSLNNNDLLSTLTDSQKYFTFSDDGFHSLPDFFTSPTCKEFRLTISTEIQGIDYFLDQCEKIRTLQTRDGVFGLAHLFLLTASCQLCMKADVLAKMAAQEKNVPAEQLFTHYENICTNIDYPLKDRWRSYEQAAQFIRSVQEEAPALAQKAALAYAGKDLVYTLSMECVYDGAKDKKHFYFSLGFNMPDKEKSYSIYIDKLPTALCVGTPKKFCDLIDLLWMPTTGDLLH